MLSQKLRSALALLGMPNLRISTAAVSVSAFVALAYLGLVALTHSSAIAISVVACLFAQGLDLVRVRIQKIKLLQNLDWPKFIDAIHSSAWAGSSILEAVLDSRRFAPRHAAWAFEELGKDIESGVDLDQSLINLKLRLDSYASDRFVELTRLAAKASGKGFLAALRSQGLQLRADNAMWQDVSAKQSWVISSGRMAVFAPWLTLLLLAMREETAAAFETSEGVSVLVFGLLMSLLAFQLVNFLGKLPSRPRVLK